MSPKKWGPNMWILFHTLPEKIKDENNEIIVTQLLSFYIRICRYLPCPECSEHANDFWSKVNLSTIKNKKNLTNILLLFHNIVNKRQNKPTFSITDLEQYKSYSTVNAYNNFASVYNTNGNMKLLADTFQRQLILQQFKKWFLTNSKYFNP